MDETGSLTLRYTRSARSDIARILDYVGDQSPQGRRHVETEFQRVFELLQNVPFLGIATNRTGLRPHAVPSFPYVVFCQMTSSALVVVAVRHTARRPRLP